MAGRSRAPCHLFFFPLVVCFVSFVSLMPQSAYINTAEKHYMRTSPFTLYLRLSVSGETIFSNLLFELEPHFLVCLFIFKWSLLLWTHSEKQPFFLACSLDLEHYFKFLSLRFCFKRLLSYIFTTLPTFPPGKLISLYSKIGVCCMQTGDSKRKPTDCQYESNLA